MKGHFKQDAAGWANSSVRFVVEMDGFDTDKGVIILAATNRPKILDPALLRTGRFDRHIALDRPDLGEREKILAIHAKQVILAPEVDLSAIAARSAGFVGADLVNLIKLLADDERRERLPTKTASSADMDVPPALALDDFRENAHLLRGNVEQVVQFDLDHSFLVPECLF